MPSDKPQYWPTHNFTHVISRCHVLNRSEYFENDQSYIMISYMMRCYMNHVPGDIPLNINVRPLLTTMCFSDLSNYEIRLISHISFFLSLTDRWGSDSDPGSNTLSGQIHDSPPSQRTAIQGNNGRSLRWQTPRLQEMNLHMSAGRRYNSFS